VVDRRRTDNTMTKRKMTKRQTTFYQTLHKILESSNTSRTKTGDELRKERQFLLHI